MSEHLFISPEHVYSARWQEAFPAAKILVQPPKLLVTHSYLWVLIVNEQTFTQIQHYSDLGYGVVAMTAVEDPAQAQRALAAGACGYIHYFAAPAVLQQVASVVALGGLWIGAELMHRLVRATVKILPARTPDVDVSALTQRELEVAQLVAQGQANKEVARQLEITERTVKAHLSAVFEKLQVRDRLQLALIFSANPSV
jgi:DNA-binding NarL/FixJ family response regulator